MTDNNHFDPIFLFTMIFPAVSDVSIYNSPSALLSTCCDGSKSAAFKSSTESSCPSTVRLLFKLLFDGLRVYIVGISTSGDSKIGVLSNSTGPAVDTVDAIGISLFSAGALKKISSTCNSAKSKGVLKHLCYPICRVRNTSIC